MAVGYQVHGQVPGKTRAGDSNPALLPERSTIIPKPKNFSDTVIHELLKSLPNDDQAKHDDMPVVRPDRKAVVPMPTTLPDNAFYRSPKDPSGMVRATLDNMPIHGYDTTTRQGIRPVASPQLPIPHLSSPRSKSRK
jgi:hypothetical protein